VRPRQAKSSEFKEAVLIPPAVAPVLAIAYSIAAGESGAIGGVAVPEVLGVVWARISP
jgi:hypothetical protein